MKRLPPVSRSEIALLVFVLLVIAFLVWSRNILVRWPGVPTPIG